MGVINSGYGTQPGQNPGQNGPPFPVTSARNGLSVDGAGKIVLGDNVGGVLSTLLNNREIPAAGFDINLSGVTGSLTIGDSPLNGNVNTGLFNNLPRFVIAGGKATAEFHVVDEGFIGGQLWGSANVLYRSNNASTPLLTNAGLFGNKVAMAVNYHYGSVGIGTPYVNAFEIWQGQNTGVDALAFSLWGQGTHVGGVFGVPTARISNSLHIGWDTGFLRSAYVLAQPQLSLRGIGGVNTQLELNNAGASAANIENAIFFSVDNTTQPIGSNYPSNKAIFAMKSTTNNAGARNTVSCYLGTTNVVQGANLTGQEIMSFVPENRNIYLPSVAVNFKLCVGGYLTNDGYEYGKVTTLVIDAFNNPFYWRNMPASIAASSFIVRDAVTDQVRTSTGASISGGGVITAVGFTNSLGATLMNSTTAFADGSAAALGTLLNAPVAGNPTKWIPINDNGTTRYIPAW